MLCSPLLNPLDNNEVAAGYLARIKEQEQTIKTLQAEVAGMSLSTFRESDVELNWSAMHNIKDKRLSASLSSSFCLSPSFPY